MLKKKYRGLSELEISELFKKKSLSSIGNTFFRINWMKSNNEYPQFVVIVNKKLHKSAVKRNTVRRKVYEMVRQEFSLWTEGIRVAILVKKSALEYSPSEFDSAFGEVIIKLENNIKTI